MSASFQQAVAVQLAARHVTTEDERQRDAAQVARIYADLEAMAYDHAAHGCPYVDDGYCPACDRIDDEPCFI